MICYSDMAFGIKYYSNDFYYFTQYCTHNISFTKINKVIEKSPLCTFQVQKTYGRIRKSLLYFILVLVDYLSRGRVTYTFLLCFNPYHTGVIYSLRVLGTSWVISLFCTSYRAKKLCIETYLSWIRQYQTGIFEKMGHFSQNFRRP